MISSAGVNEIEAIELNGVVVIYSLEKMEMLVTAESGSQQLINEV